MNLKRPTAFVLIALSAFSATLSSAAPWPPKRGDLILGFQATRGLGSDVNMFFNLGPAHKWRDATAATQEAGNLGADLAEAYGKDWFQRKDLWFGAIANFTNRKNDPATHGDPPRTFYLSRPALSPGKSIPWSGLSEMSLGSAATFIGGQYDMLATLTPHASGMAEVLFTDVVNWQNGWTFWNPVDARGQQIAYRRFEGGLQNHFGQTTGTVFLDVQRVTAVSEEAGKPSTQAGTGTVVFYISLNQDGLIRIGVK